MSHEKGYLGPMQDQRLESLGAGLGKQLRRNKNGCLGTYFYVFGEKYGWLQGSSCTSFGDWWIFPLYCEFHTNVKHGRSFRSEQVQHDMGAGRLPALEFRSTKLISLNSIQLSIEKMVPASWVTKATKWDSAEEALSA